MLIKTQVKLKTTQKKEKKPYISVSLIAFLKFLIKEPWTVCCSVNDVYAAGLEHRMHLPPAHKRLW